MNGLYNSLCMILESWHQAECFSSMILWMLTTLILLEVSEYVFLTVCIFHWQQSSQQNFLSQVNFRKKCPSDFGHSKKQHVCVCHCVCKWGRLRWNDSLTYNVLINIYCCWWLITGLDEPLLMGTRTWLGIYSVTWSLWYCWFHIRTPTTGIYDKWWLLKWRYIFLIILEQKISSSCFIISESHGGC